MLTENHYHNSLLLLSYLIMQADGIVERSEIKALQKICNYEGIDKSVFGNFITDVGKYTEREIHDLGIEEVLQCGDRDKINVFAWLHRISEADDKVHVREVRFLLYSTKKAGIEFKDVMERSAGFPALA